MGEGGVADVKEGGGGGEGRGGEASQVYIMYYVPLPVSIDSMVGRSVPYCSSQARRKIHSRSIHSTPPCEHTCLPFNTPTSTPTPHHIPAHMHSTSNLQPAHLSRQSTPDSQLSSPPPHFIHTYIPQPAQPSAVFPTPLTPNAHSYKSGNLAYLIPGFFPLFLPLLLASDCSTYDHYILFAFKSKIHLGLLSLDSVSTLSFSVSFSIPSYLCTPFSIGLIHAWHIFTLFHCLVSFLSTHTTHALTLCISIGSPSRLSIRHYTHITIILRLDIHYGIPAYHPTHSFHKPHSLRC